MKFNVVIKIIGIDQVFVNVVKSAAIMRLNPLRPDDEIDCKRKSKYRVCLE